MKKVYGLLFALIFSAATMAFAAPSEKATVKTNSIASGYHTTSTQQDHRKVVVVHHRRRIHHRHHRPHHTTVVVHH